MLIHITEYSIDIDISTYLENFVLKYFNQTPNFCGCWKRYDLYRIRRYTVIHIADHFVGIDSSTIFLFSGNIDI